MTILSNSKKSSSTQQQQQQQQASNNSASLAPTPPQPPPPSPPTLQPIVVSQQICTLNSTLSPSTVTIGNILPQVSNVTTNSVVTTSESSLSSSQASPKSLDLLSVSQNVSSLKRSSSNTASSPTTVTNSSTSSNNGPAVVSVSPNGGSSNRVSATSRCETESTIVGKLAQTLGKDDKKDMPVASNSLEITNMPTVEVEFEFFFLSKLNSK
jgi:hypothetical protein